MAGFLRLLAALLVLSAAATPAAAEEGYDLWLRYRPLAIQAQARLRPMVSGVVTEEADPRIAAAAGELRRAAGGLLGVQPNGTLVPGAAVLGTPGGSPIVRGLGLRLLGLGDEGFRLKSAVVHGQRVTVVAANTSAGVLYGTFALIERLQLGESLAGLDLADAPRLKIRVLDHWDNLDRTVERGYAGQSLWDWPKLPQYLDPRYTDYARANASIGINGTVLNNVNSNADMLTPALLAKVTALADVFRPWGIRVYLSARFSAPIEIGGLRTADPLGPAVRAWWRGKVEEIYRLIPDFGGFLVKANSEGQPGPQTYGRNHADGANMLADALRPHGGVVMWRAFVYSETNPEDRAKQAYSEFHRLDGEFRDNVVIQIKNGPIDFQPREPFHPLFGAMPHTPTMMEVQITKEYLGMATHLAYLGTMWEEALKADTCRPRCGTSVARTLETPVAPGAPTAMAGVANVGTDRNWSGSQFNQANWYAFGRLAWNPEESAEAIARDWARLTWTSDPAVVEPIVAMMMRSREAVVDYMTPLGLAHQMATGHHYGPGPWVSDLARPEWNPVYYARADANGIGFDRTASGSDAVAQYAAPVAARFSDVATTPETLLLWFHRLPWDHRTASGRTLWDELVARYDRGVAAVAAMQVQWDALRGRVDEGCWNEVHAYLQIQHDEAQWWRDASIAWFESRSKLPLPAGHAEPPHPLAFYQAIRIPYAPGGGK